MLEKNKQNKEKDWNHLEELEDQAGGLLACGFIDKLAKIDEDQWIMDAAELENGCSVTAGSLDPEAFFRSVQENRKKVERILDEMGIEKAK